jgi:hypothetical protein
MVIMADLRKRVERLEAQTMCALHHTALSCIACDWPDPEASLTLAEEIELDAWADRLCPNKWDNLSIGGPCTRCGGPMVCDECIDSGDAAADRQLADNLAELAPEEHTRLLTLLDKSGLLF